MDLAGFGNPWEHIRLLSDQPRNQALVDLLGRHAPGARVLEVGCGTGLLSLVAARLGARRVHAVEPTPLVELARELVRHNGLEDRVIVHEGRVQDIDPHPVDLAFSELLNADPFVEQVVPAMHSAATWLAPGGRLAPRRLRVHVALARASDSAREARNARREVQRLEAQHGLDLAPLLEALKPDEPYKAYATTVVPAGPAVCVWDVALGEVEEVEDFRNVELEVDDPGPVSGALVWFEAELDDALTLSNHPDMPREQNHWGQLVCAWSEEVGMGLGKRLPVIVELDGDELEVRLPRSS